MDLQRFISIVRGHTPYIPTEAEWAVAERSFRFLEEFARQGVVYGINTGFGPMAQRAVSEADHKSLQYNLVRSHAAGAGTDLSDETVRAMLLVRAVTFLQGGSAVSRAVIEQLLAFLRMGICPRVPEQGGVGASGDLTQQAHLGLGLIGEGTGRAGGEREAMADILMRHGLSPVQLQLRDGLAIVNGTACMTGIGLLNVDHAYLLLDRAVAMSSMLTETIGSWDDHLSAPLNEAKRHAGQREIASRMREALTGSALVRKRPRQLPSNPEPDQVNTFTDVVQEHYSIRCVPQILGPVLDTIRQAEHVLLDELLSVDDNPLTDPSSGVFHGGNFHGDQVALEMDKLRLAVVKLCMLCERQLNFLLNDRVNQRFPAFLNLERPGITLGLQGMQFTAVSNTAENQALATSLYVHSIPNNNDNQDLVSMGTNAALMTRRVLDNTARVMAISAIALAQAVDIADSAMKLSPAGRVLHAAIRSATPAIRSTSDPSAATEAVERVLFRPLQG